MTLKLQTIVASTRPGRVGPGIAKWFNEFAAEHGKFEPTLVDLASFDLPIFDEPEHPMKQAYKHDHTKAWAEREVGGCLRVRHAGIQLQPASALVNALNYLSLEWNYAPAGIVSYGGISGGLRAAQAAKQLLTTLKMMPIPEGVPMPMVFQNLDENGNLKPLDIYKTSAATMLDELHRWAEALKSLQALRKAPAEAKAAA